MLAPQIETIAQIHTFLLAEFKKFCPLNLRSGVDRLVDSIVQAQAKSGQGLDFELLSDTCGNEIFLRVFTSLKREKIRASDQQSRNRFGIEKRIGQFKPVAAVVTIGLND